mmetsp:Transcript_67749/g.195871  ORF Transcript_67749/g.195871 Transcript_67749/m.195871 type:complete len:234 (-) Transcript_67749:1511-2212(-)
MSSCSNNRLACRCTSSCKLLCCCTSSLSCCKAVSCALQLLACSATDRLDCSSAERIDSCTTSWSLRDSSSKRLLTHSQLASESLSERSFSPTAAHNLLSRSETRSTASARERRSSCTPSCKRPSRWTSSNNCCICPSCASIRVHSSTDESLNSAIASLMLACPSATRPSRPIAASVDALPRCNSPAICCNSLSWRTNCSACADNVCLLSSAHFWKHPCSCSRKLRRLPADSSA